MIPREAGRGQSFKGAGAYYLHDKGALTSERVEFTHTENVPTNDPHKALKWMTWTAMHAEDMKHESGAKATGRPCTKPVFTFSLSWHPEQEPKKWEMIGAGRRALIALGLQDHETVMVAHNDCDHQHLHVIVNVIDPETGKANRVPFSKKKLSVWAEEYEREHGNIYCDKRVENNAKRAEGEKVKYEEPALDIKTTVTKLFRESENGEEFRKSLADQGLTLARGKKLVIIDRQGNVHSLSRQIEGAKEKQVRAELGDLELPDIDVAKKQITAASQTQESNPEVQAEVEPTETATEKQRDNEPEYFDRDQQDHDWQESIIDAGLEHEENKFETPTPLPRPISAKTVRREPPKGAKTLKELFPEPQRPQLSPSELNRLQDRHLAELGEFYANSTRARLTMTATLDAQYGVQERQLRQDIEHLEATLKNSGRLRVWWLKVTHQIPKTVEQDLHGMQQTLGNIEWRKSEARQALENEAARQRQFIEARHLRERHELHPEPQSQSENRDTTPVNDTEMDEDFGPSFGLYGA